MEGLRIVFEIKRDSEPNVVLNNMYKRTPLQNSFAGNLMAVVGAGRMPEQVSTFPSPSHRLPIAFSFSLPAGCMPLSSSRCARRFSTSSTFASNASSGAAGSGSRRPTRGCTSSMAC